VRSPFALALALLLVACSAADAPPGSPDDAGIPGDDGAIVTPDADAGGSTHDAAPDADPCTTRVSYGSTWIHGSNHPDSFDVASGAVTWDGRCADDGANSYAVFSNGWKPYFQGHGACVVALDYAGSCASGKACSTRVSYGGAWLPPPNHPNAFDDLAGRVFSDGLCPDSGADSYADLSNGWQPHFTGHGTCETSFAYTQCGGLYENPVIPFDCPDPGVLADGGQYVLTCTSGNAQDAFPIFTSADLVHWTAKAHVFPSGKRPGWATSDFWAPEIHKVGSHYVAYFSARDQGGVLSVGAASASSPLGPFTDIGHPLIHDPNMGLIDASEIDANGTPYVLWKEDGNAVGKQTPIHAQKLAPDGLSLVGGASTLITNDQGWEGALVEGPFMIAHGGSYYLFYSGNAYAGASYAIGVARASSPLGPFTKAPGPILTTRGAWAGPGHCSVVDTPAGDTYMVFHAWESGSVGGGPGRLVLTDAVSWSNGWPGVPLAPSRTTRPMP